MKQNFYRFFFYYTFIIVKMKKICKARLSTIKFNLVLLFYMLNQKGKDKWKGGGVRNGVIRLMQSGQSLGCV